MTITLNCNLHMEIFLLQTLKKQFQNQFKFHWILPNFVKLFLNLCFYQRFRENFRDNWTGFKKEMRYHLLYKFRNTTTFLVKKFPVVSANLDLITAFRWWENVWPEKSVRFIFRVVVASKTLPLSNIGLQVQPPYTQFSLQFGFNVVWIEFSQTHFFTP